MQKRYWFRRCLANAWGVFLTSSLILTHFYSSLYHHKAGAYHGEILAASFSFGSYTAESLWLRLLFFMYLCSDLWSGFALLSHCLSTNESNTYREAHPTSQPSCCTQELIESMAPCMRLVQDQARQNGMWERGAHYCLAPVNGPILMQMWAALTKNTN